MKGILKGVYQEAKMEETKKFEVTKVLVDKVNKVVAKGLSSGIGNPRPGFMCVEAAVCYALGEPHSDHPTCVSDVVRAFKIELNDEEGWKNKKDRAEGLRRVAIAQLGSKGVVKDKAFQLEMWRQLRALYCELVVEELGRRLDTAKTGEKVILVSQAAKLVKLVNKTLPTHYVSYQNERRINSPMPYHLINAVEKSLLGGRIFKRNPNRLLHRIAEATVQALFKLKSPGTKFIPKHLKGVK